MRIKTSTIAAAAFILVLMTVIPVLVQAKLPEELYTYFSKTSGIDLRALLNEVAVVGIIVAANIVAGSMFEKNTAAGFTASTVTRVIWFMIIVFSLSLGDLGHLGVARVGSGNGVTLNFVEIDLRLFVFLIGAIIAMNIGQTYIEYHENKKSSTAN